jgi:hypothetical protein
MRNAARKGRVPGTEPRYRDVGERCSDEETPFERLRHRGMKSRGFLLDAQAIKVRHDGLFSKASRYHRRKP